MNRRLPVYISLYGLTLHIWLSNLLLAMAGPTEQLNYMYEKLTIYIILKFNFTIVIFL